jgi:hypothetical protein
MFGAAKIQFDPDDKIDYGKGSELQFEKSTVAVKCAAAKRRGSRVLIRSRDFNNPTARTGGGVFVLPNRGTAA